MTSVAFQAAEALSGAAADAIESKGPITIRTGTQGDEVWAEVADTGQGSRFRVWLPVQQPAREPPTTH